MGQPATQQQLRLRQARLRFAEGDPLPQRLVGEMVARSWERSRQSGIMPWEAPRFVQAPRAARDALESDRQLRHAIHDEIEPLWSAFGGPQWAIFCVNATGMVVDIRQSAAGEGRPPLAAGVGYDLSETAIGTTAPSCVLREGTEVILKGGEHYLTAFESLSCLSVPLRGIDGEIVGALDITGRGDRDLDVLRHHFQQASHAAEARMLESLGRCHILRLHHDPRWLPSPLAGTLAVDDDGLLRGASAIARKLLRLPAQGAVRGIALTDVLPDALPAQKRRFLVHAQTPQRLLLTDGSHLWMMHARSPAKGSHRGDVPEALPEPPVLRDWREEGLKAIADVLNAHEGNIAAAARALGMSRTTLYARIRALRQAGLY